MGYGAATPTVQHAMRTQCGFPGRNSWTSAPTTGMVPNGPARLCRAGWSGVWAGPAKALAQAPEASASRTHILAQSPQHVVLTDPSVDFTRPSAGPGLDRSGALRAAAGRHRISSL